MGYPTVYDREYNFQDYQRDNPSAPLPAEQVDAEFNSVKVALDSTQGNLKIIQRSDGFLANGSVGQDQLSPSLSIGFTLRGPWMVNTAYAVSDGVTLSTKFYRAIVANGSTALNRPDLDSTTWQLVADFGSVSGDVAAITASLGQPNGIATLDTVGHVTIAEGGTGAGTAAAARTNLGAAPIDAWDGHCQLQYVDATHIKLMPFEGNTLLIGSSLAIIPDGGVSFAATSLSATTYYYVYAVLTGSAVTLELSTTGPATQSGTGRSTKSGDASRRLVGLVYCNTANTFVAAYVRTWFNDLGVEMSTVLAASTSFGAASPASLMGLYPLMWPNERYQITTAITLEIYGTGAATTPYHILNIGGANVASSFITLVNQNCYYSTSLSFSGSYTGGIMTTLAQGQGDGITAVLWIGGYCQMSIKTFGSGH